MKPDIPANRISYVWVYKAQGTNVVSGIFTNFRVAHEWIKAHTLSGMLVHYPLDKGVYDWALENDFLSKVQLANPSWRAEFTPAIQIYHIYQDGVCLTWPEYDQLSEDEVKQQTEEWETYYPSHRNLDFEHKSSDS